MRTASMMTPGETRITQVFLDFPMQIRAGVWCSLNRFQWPREFSAFKPDGWDAMQSSDRMKTPEAVLLWAIANEHTTFKECLREWNKERMSNAEFEAWWITKGPGRNGP